MCIRDRRSFFKLLVTGVTIAENLHLIGFRKAQFWTVFPTFIFPIISESATHKVSSCVRAPIDASIIEVHKSTCPVWCIAMVTCRKAQPAGFVALRSPFFHNVSPDCKGILIIRIVVNPAFFVTQKPTAFTCCGTHFSACLLYTSRCV